MATLTETTLETFEERGELLECDACEAMTTRDRQVDNLELVGEEWFHDGVDMTVQWTCDCGEHHRERIKL